MIDKLKELMKQGKFEKVVKLAFAADGPLADNTEAIKSAQALVGHQFAYNSDVIETRDGFFRTAAEFIMREVVANEWQK